MDPTLDIPQAAQGAQSLLDRVIASGMSSQGQYLAELKAAEPLLAIAAIVVGVVLLLFGWRVFKVWVVVNAAIVGLLLGDRIAVAIARPELQLWLSLGLAVVLAMVSWSLMKFAISILGGMAGGFIGYHGWRYVASLIQRPELAQYDWVAALVCMVVMGLLAFMIFRAIVVAATSIQGSLLLVSGALALCLKLPALDRALSRPLLDSSHLLSLLIAIPAVVGIIYQSIKPAPAKDPQEQ